MDAPEVGFTLSLSPCLVALFSFAERERWFRSQAAHFGRPAQPLSAEALEFLRGKVLGRKVKVLLSSKDQVRRVLPFFSRTLLSRRSLSTRLSSFPLRSFTQYGRIVRPLSPPLPLPTRPPPLSLS